MDKLRTAFSRSQSKRDEEKRSHQFIKRHSNSLYIHTTPHLTLSELSPLTNTSNKPSSNEPSHLAQGLAVDEGIECGLLKDGLARQYNQLKALPLGVDGKGDRMDMRNAQSVAPRQETPRRSVSLVEGANPDQVLWKTQPFVDTSAEAFGSTLLGATSRQQQQGSVFMLPITTTPQQHSFPPVSTPTFVPRTQPASSLMPAASATSSYHHQPPLSYNNVNTFTSPGPSHMPQLSSPMNTLDCLPSSALTETSLPVPFHQQHHQYHTTASNQNRNVYSHSRSRSVPYAAHDIPPPSVLDNNIASPIMSTRSSLGSTSLSHHLSQHTFDQTKSLLLTQTFTPLSDDDTPKSTNPFEEHAPDENSHTTQPPIENPFDDNANEGGCDFGRGVTTNRQPNGDDLPAPPVPPQSTKPPHPRYRRNQPLKRSQSQYSRQNPFVSQGTRLLAISSVLPSVPSPPFDARLSRHRSVNSFPSKLQ